MKNLAMTLLTIFLLSANIIWSQCVFSCYTYSTSPITFSNFPSNGPNVINSFLPSIDDGITAPIPLGFNFNYYCGTYSTVLICSNGFIQFDIGSPPNLAFSNPAQSFPDPTSPNGIVALNMNDLDPNMGGSITYTSVGTSPNQMFIVTYSNVPLWSCNTILNTGQIILYEGSNIIEIHTGSVADPFNLSLQPCYPGTQGIENPTGTAGSMVTGRNNSNWNATSSSAYRFSPIANYTPAPQTATIDGIVSLCFGAQATYSIPTNSNALSYNWSFPFGWNGTSTLSSITATAGSSGNVSVSAVYTCGVTSPITLSVNVIPLPVVSITSATPVIFCSGETVTITTSGAITYTLEPGNMIGTPPFLHVPQVNTTYTVMGTNIQGCNSNNLATFQVTVKQTPTISVNSSTLCLGGEIQLMPSGANTYTFYTPALSPFPNVTPTSAGTHTYLVVGTSSNGCIGENAYSTNTVYALPNVQAMPSRTSICAKEINTITVSGAVNYSWSTGATGSSITVTPFSVNQYSVTGIDANGCENSATISLVVNNCTGLQSIATPNLFSVFPNPSSGLYSIDSGKDLEVNVVNTLGQMVFSEKIRAGSHVIDLRHLDAGTYFLSATSGDATKKIVLIKE